MAPQSAQAAAGGRGDRWHARWRRLIECPLARVLVVYAVSRAYSSALLAAMFTLASALGWPFASRRSHPTFFTFSGSWDAWFYRSIAEHGYPATLPVDDLGHVSANPWAFLPLFPLLERAVTELTGVSSYVAGTLIAVVAGAGAAIILERLLRTQIGPSRALSAVGLFCFGPLAFVLQVAYAESLFLLLVFAALLAVQRERYLICIPFVTAAAFTRPGAIAIPAAIALQLAVRWVRDRQRPRRLAHATVAVLIGSAASLAWPVIADLATGRHGTYLDTELSWWTGWVGRPGFVPFTPWYLMTSRWLGPAGVVAAVLLAAATLFWILWRSPRELGATIRWYSTAYLLYLIAVFLPQFSLPRLLMPLAPLLGAATFTGSPGRRSAWMIAAATTQPIGIVLLWFLSYP